MRKTISLVLAVLMMLALLPAVKLNSASADSVEKTYTLVSSADDLTADGSYLVVSANAAGEAKALANQKSNNRGVADVTVTEDLTIVLTSDQLAAAADDAKPFELKLGGNAADGWSFYDEIGSGFLFAPCAVNSSNGKAYNYMRTQAENNDNGLFTITIDGETYTIVSKGGNIETDAVYMRFNSGASCISCYTAGSSVQAPVYLYKLTSATDSGDPDPDPEPEPETTAMELVTELEDGDEIVIFNPGSNVVMTAEDYLYNESKHELKPAAATLTDGTLAAPEEAVVLTVELTATKDIDAEKTFAFKTADNKYLYVDGTHVQLVERTEENAEYTLFALDDLGDGGFYVKCLTAQYSGKDQYLQYFHDYFTVYSLNASYPERYKMQFFAEPAEEPEPVEPTGNTIILFTNDVHCGIRDGWGYAGLADLKKTLEAEGNEVILVDAGDHVQGGPIGSLTQGEAIIDIMNFVGYDLATLGNHEFDYGMDQMFALVEQAEYPYVSANFVKVDGNEPVLDAYKIFEANGKKIAFVGISTPESITKSTPTYFMNEDNTAYVYGFCQDATGEGVYTAVQNAIDAAKAEGADFVILVGHMGIDEQSSPWMSTEVIANITGADAFIDGHSHSVINEVVEDKNEGGKGVLHGQTGTKLANVGMLTIDAEGGLTMEILPASEKVKDDPETDEYIKGIEDEFNALLNTVVAHTDHDLTVLDPDTNNRAVRSKETNLGDLCADAYRFMFDADVAFVNGGGVRADIPTGDITFQQIINVHPFGNTAVLAEVTGQQILDALEHGSASNPGESGGFLQVAGLKYEIHNYLPANEIVDDQKMWVSNAGLDEYRVKNVQVLNKETGEYEDLDLAKKYTLASHNYMLKDMGDGYAMFGANITVLNDSGIADNKVLIDYIQSMPEVDGVHQVEGYTDPRGEGRITIYAEAPTPVEPTGDTIILFTNDVHCGIRDGWGYAGLADLKKTLEAEGNEVLLVDAGDHVQGAAIGSLTQGEAIIDIMNFVGYDLATLGNHEFDYGMDQMFALVEQAEFPYVSANFVKVEGNTPVLDAYKIFEVNGKKIAFVGLATPESITKSTPTYFMNEDNTAYVYGFCQDATGEGVYAAAQTAIDAAKAEGADYVILVGHMGIDEQSSPWMSTEVIANTTGLTAFIDGHSHSVINAVEVADKDGNKVLHGQTGTKLANVGKLTIKADGTVTMEILPASEKVKDDPETDAYIKTIEDEFDALLKSVVAYTDHILTVNDPDTGARAVRKAETNLGDLCADAYQFMFDSDIAFVNGGGVRANINVGDITFNDIIAVHPFGNTAVLAEVTGQQILDALEHGSASNPGESGGFLQVAGLKYEIHNYLPANEVIGSDKMWQGTAGLDEYRVKNVQVMNKETGEYEPLDLEKKYTLASHNYMLEDMGDGYAMFGANITILNESGIPDNKVLIDYIQSMPEVDGKHQVTGYTDPRGEGRITIVSEAPKAAPTFYGENVDAADVVEEVEGEELYRYDVKVKGIDSEAEVVGLQAFVQFDAEALEFVNARSTLEGNLGINEADGVLSFAWASNGNGITIEDETVIVSLYFRLLAPVEDGTAVAFTFVPAENGALTGYSYVSGTTVVEAEGVLTEDGSITFAVPRNPTFYGEDVISTDVMTVVDGERLYRYDIRVDSLPEAGLKVNSAQIFLTYDTNALEFRSAEGKLDWTAAEKRGKLMAVWASETPVLLENEDVVLTVYFAAPKAKAGSKVDIEFTMNLMDTSSAVSFTFGGKVLELEAITVDGSITFADILLGDANCDGAVTAADAALVLRSIVGLNELSAQGALNADVDGDLEITAEDAALILRYIVKLIEKFPVEE